jgi:hypothetical protein
MSVVVALYSKTDTMVRPWLEAGHSAVIVDLQHPAGETQDGRLTRIGANMLDWVPPHWLARADVRLTAAFPPCDHMSPFPVRSLVRRQGAWEAGRQHPPVRARRFLVRMVRRSIPHRKPGQHDIELLAQAGSHVPSVAFRGL